MNAVPLNPVSSSSEPHAERRPAIMEWLLVSTLLLIYVLQCAWFIRTQSLSFDEPLHTYAGLQNWREGRFEFSADHPPLARLWGTLLILDSQWQVSYPLPYGTIRIYPDPEAMARRVRPMYVVLGVFLGLLIWAAARRWFSPGGALLALALFCFSPELIAHFSLANTDGIVILLLFATALYVTLWRHNPSWPRTLLLGVLLGVLLVAKFSAPPSAALAVLLVLVLKPEGTAFRPSQWNWGKACAVVALAFFTVWAAYSFHVSKVTLRNRTLTVASPGRQPQVVKVPIPGHFSFYVPAGEFFEGFAIRIVRNRVGQAAYFLGEVRKRWQGGWRSYFVVAMVLKWPLPVLALSVFTLVLLFWRKIAWPADLSIPALFAIVYFLPAVLNTINIGVRHVLPMYPFLLLLIAACWDFARTRRALAALILAVVALQAVDCLRWGPDYLSYFNFYARPRPGHELLSDSNLDWGQGLLALRDYQAQHPNELMHLAYFGSIDPSTYGIRFTPLLPGHRVSGLVVVSATLMTGQYLPVPNSYHWLLKYPVRTVLNHSLYVYEVPVDGAVPAADPSRP